MKRLQFNVGLCAIALLTAVSFNGCQKGELEIVSSETDQVVQAPKFENPFDFVGDLHNDLMVRYSEEPDFLNLTDQEVIDVTNSFAKANDLVDIPAEQLLPKVKPVAVFAMDNRSDLSQILLLPTLLQQQGFLTSKQADRFDKLFQILVQNNDDPDKLLDKVVNWENNVNNRNDMSDVEKDQLLMASAVLKASHQFFEEAVSDPGNPYFEVYNDIDLDQPEICIICAIDAIGAAIGAGIGGAVSNEPEAPAIGAGLGAAVSSFIADLFIG